MTKKFLLARKRGMTQVFREDGTVVPVTVLQAGPCTVTGLRDKQRDGYRAVQLGLTPARDKRPGLCFCGWVAWLCIGRGDRPAQEA